MERMPTTNRIINWNIRDTELSLRSSGYRGNLASLIIDKKVEVKKNETS